MDAIGDRLHKAARPADEEWRTPHERGQPPGLCAAWEMEQFEASVCFLRGLAGGIPIVREAALG